LEENVYFTKLLLTLYMLELNEDKEIIAFNIINEDSLAPGLLAKFKQPKINQGFDYIVGNPPYVKIQDIDHELRKTLKKNYKTCDSGSYNLFYAFIELSNRLIKKDGKMGYIVPNHILKMKSAQSLRELLIFKRLISKVIDFKDNILFENAQTYSAIMFFDNITKDFIYYKTIDENIKNKKLNKLLHSIKFY